MMKKRNILMCLQQLDIGGVETAVMTLCKGYKRAGANVFVAAKSGVYNSELEKIGVKFFEIEYEFLNKFALDKKEELYNFCKENDINEIHIHQYPCVLYWLPVCLEYKIPYVTYVHSIVGGAPQWFMKDFPIHRFALPIFFANASKIVCIAESTKEEIQSLFDVPLENYMIIPNSLNMVDFDIPVTFTEIKIFGMAARFSEEKMLSLKNGIDLFLEYSKVNPDSKLIIAGDGDKRRELEDYAKGKNIEFLGPVSDMVSFFKKVDVFMGVDRCILEALACKKLSVICGYNGSINIVSSDNIDVASLQNFSGKNLTNDDNVIEKLLSIDSDTYASITNSNYEFINDKYNVDNNLYNYDLNSNFSNEYVKLFISLNDILADIDNKNYLLQSSCGNKHYIKRFLNKVKKGFRKLFRRS